MFYKEKIINGVLNYKTHPNCGWTPYTIETLSKRVLYLEKQLSDLRNENGIMREEIASLNLHG